MRLLSLAWVVIALVGLGAADMRPRYDERGNPVSSVETGGQTGGGAGAAEAGQNVAGQAVVAPNAAGIAPSKADDEEGGRQSRSPLTKVYLENAQLYLRSDRIDKALEFLRRSQEAGEDGYAREARLQAYWLRARRGDAGLTAEAENLDEAQKLSALLRVADGYSACAREAKPKVECLPEAERVYALLAELAPTAQEGKLAALRLAQLLLEQGRPEAALPLLTRVVADEQKSGNRARVEPYDRAWFSLGNLYERPWYHRDTHKARLAYQQVLRYPDSPYHSQAKERIALLERFGTGPVPAVRP